MHSIACQPVRGTLLDNLNRRGAVVPREWDRERSIWSDQVAGIHHRHHDTGSGAGGRCIFPDVPYRSRGESGGDGYVCRGKPDNITFLLPPY